MSHPAHHRSDGRFRNPWPEAAGDDALRKRFSEVAREWARRPPPPAPAAVDVPVVPHRVAREGASPGEARSTWVGHSTFLIQLPRLNVLTDPVWSERVSPVPLVGARRLMPPGIPWQDLPDIDAVLISHDHFDHLDRRTVRKLARRYGAALTWLTPLGYRGWFARLGVGRVRELDWWESIELEGGWRAVCAPARHWSRRTPWGTNRRLWCSWALVSAAGTGGVYFGGDSGYATVFGEIGERLGPFDASILPIGAYDPRWFMQAAHMTPEEAVRVYADLGARGAMVPAHWATFRLTFEPPLEPPERLRAAWADAGLPSSDLRVPRHGESLTHPLLGASS